jgi:endonuclease-3 related protein
MGQSIQSSIRQVYETMLAWYGPQKWWPGESNIEIIVGAILTQGTAWTSVEKSLLNLKTAGVLSLSKLNIISQGELATLIRPCGAFRVKSRRIKAFIFHIYDKYMGDLDNFLSRDILNLRKELLSIHGIGNETADAIILYASGKPSFVIDSYTRRILSRLKLTPTNNSYRSYQDLFQENLPLDQSLYSEYHALLVSLAKDVCHKTPVCDRCCLANMCPTGSKR